MSKNGKLLVVSAPSGCGKDTIVSEYIKRNPKSFKSVSATTRQKRGMEVDGVNYYFLTVEKFRELIKEGGLLEYAEYCNNFYGTPIEPIKKHLEKGENVFLIIDVQGAEQIKMKYPDAVTIFIMPPSVEELKKRITGRGMDSGEAIEIRMKTAETEMIKAKSYDYIIINNEVEQAVSELAEIVNK